MEESITMIRALILFSLLAMISSTMAADNSGLISKKSPYSVSQTLDRLEAILKKKEISVVTRWSHDQGAKKAGIPLRPTELLIFGNPKLGSHLFSSRQTAGIDLPMKALAWQDENGQVWLSYNDPAYLAARHQISDRSDTVSKMSAALDTLSNAAIAP